MKIKNLLLISICLFSFGSFAGNGVKKVTEMDLRRFFSCPPIYEKYKNSSDPKMKKLVEYTADVFVQYFVLACEMKGDMIYALDVVYNNDENPTPKELLQKGEAEAHRQGITIPNISRKK